MSVGMLKKEIARYIFLLIGLFTVALGIVIMIETQIGVPPWDVLHLGLFYKINILTLGQVVQGIGLILVLLCFFLKVKPSIATILNMLFVGIFIDLIYFLGFIQVPENILLLYPVFLLGSAIMGFGTATYMSVNRGSGPRDSLMVALTRITRLNMGLIRTFLEITVILVGYLLGGPLGIGTLIFALTIGFFMQKSFSFHKSVKKSSFYRSLDKSFFNGEDKSVVR